MLFTRDRWPQKGNCFVLMPFGVQKLRDGQDFDWDEHYRDVIAETIREAGMVPLRADEIYGAGSRLERLWQGIQEAEVIVADLTGRSPNVLYELGLAHVIGKRILILTRHPEDVPVHLGEFAQVHYREKGRDLLQLTRELQRTLAEVRQEPSSEAMLMPLRGAGIEEIPARVLTVMPEFAMIEASDGRKGFLRVEDFSWTRKPNDLTKLLKIGQELKGAFFIDSNGQQKYSLTFGDNPWPKLEKEFPVNVVFRSVVVNVRAGTGAWVNMNYGIHGFIPQGQLPQDVMAGMEVKARVVEINQAKREVKLQFIEILGDQAKGDIAWPFHRGQVLEGRIERIAPDRGFALVKVTHEDQPATGILLQAKMAPALRERFFNQELTVGQPLIVEVVDADPVRRKLSFRDHMASETAISAPAGREEVQFAVYSPVTVLPASWNPLLAYCHVPEATREVEQDSWSHLAPTQVEYRKSSAPRTQLIARETEFTIMPFLPGCRFNPQHQSVAWLEGMHRVEFRFQAAPGLEGFAINIPLPGRLLFFVGPVLVGEVRFEIVISETAHHEPPSANAKYSAKSLSSVFVSYSHEDSPIVDGLERAYGALGLDYLRDLRILRSGDRWQDKILEKIEEADVFQLCWSYSAQRSEYVEKEWRHALKQQRPEFIRPIYWESPKPVPPTELAGLHFWYYQLK